MAMGGAGNAAAHLQLAHEGRHARAQQNARLDGSRHVFHHFTAQFGGAENKENNGHQDLQGNQGLDGRRPGFELGHEKQHHRNGRRDPARHHGNAENGRQHKADAADKNIGQSDFIRQSQVFFQQRDHGQTDHEKDEGLDELHPFPSVVNQGKPDLERAETPEGLLLTVLPRVK